MFGFYYFDYTYFIYMLPALIISMIAQARVNSAFHKYSKISNSGRITGAEAASRVLSLNGVPMLEIRPIPGKLSDNFDPRTNVINLSGDVYGSAAIAAVGVAAHEAGHAVQHAKGYWPITLRSALVPITRIGSNLAVPIILIGLILPIQYDFVVTIGIALYSLAVVFSLVTLPVEFNASARALRALDESGILTQEELKGAGAVLRAAAMTYVASTFAALLSLLRLLAIVGSRRGNR